MSTTASPLRRASILVCALALPLGLAAEDQAAYKSRHHHYMLVDTGTLGGPNSSLGFEGERAITNHGTVVALADTSIPDPNCSSAPDCLIGHAVRWRDGVLTDLGALSPTNSNGPIWISETGLVAGFSLNGLIDPFTGGPEVRAMLFRDGNVVDLGTLGGNESTAFGVNDRGQVVGCATTATPDNFHFCLGAPQQSRAFLWKDGKMIDLGTLGGPDALAELVNNQGEVAGFSLVEGTTATQHLFLWKNGNMRDLGTIGGTAVQSINGMNDRGQIVGGMNVAGDQAFHPFLWDGAMLRDLGTLGGDFGSANLVSESEEVIGWALTQDNEAFHAFLWRKGRMVDLGSVGADPNSVAYGINSKDQVVGGTYDIAGNEVHAFLWEEGSIADLNSLTPRNSSVRLTVALGINGEGQIAAEGVLPGAEKHVFVLIPCDENHPDIESCDYSPMEVSTVSAGHVPIETAPRERMTPQEVTRIRDLLMNRNLQAHAQLPSMQELRATNEGIPVRLLQRRLAFGRFMETPQRITSDAAAISAPSVSLAPTSLAFSTQTIGTTSAAKTVALKNTDTTTVTISGIAVTGTNAGDFAQTHTCTSSLAAGASCSISVTFKPTASGTRTAALSVTDNAAGSPQKVSLTGIGTTAKLSPTSLNFGTMAIGATSTAHTVTLSNVGTTSLTISGIAVTGTNAADFAQTHTCGSLLAAGASCSISVTFKPTASGTRTAALSITDNAAGSPQKVSLTGIGTTARLSPTSLNFVTVAIGATSTAHTVTLSNVGMTSLTISGIAVTGTNAADFAQTHTCGSLLAAGASCSISVTFKPTASGTRTAALSITDNAAGSPQKAALSGTGVFLACWTVGQQCYALRPCCPGLQCVALGNRHFCEHFGAAQP